MSSGYNYPVHCMYRVILVIQHSYISRILAVLWYSRCITRQPHPIKSDIGMFKRYAQHPHPRPQNRGRGCQATQRGSVRMTVERNDVRDRREERCHTGGPIDDDRMTSAEAESHSVFLRHASRDFE